MVGEEQRGLAGRVAAADDHDRVVHAQLRLDLGGRVVDARALELLEPGDGQPAVAGAGRDDQGAGGQRVAAARRTTWCSPEVSSATASAGAHRGPELLGLQRRRARPARRRRCRPGSRGSSRSATTCPPGRRWRRRRGPGCAGPPTRRRRRRPGRPDRRRPRPGRSWDGGRAGRSPISAASSALSGLRSTSSRQTTTGVSSGVTPSSRSSDSASASVSRSTNRCGSRLRAANSRSRRVSGENREPTMRKPCPSPMSRERRIR